MLNKIWGSKSNPDWEISRYLKRHPEMTEEEARRLAELNRLVKEDEDRRKDETTELWEGD